MPVSLVEVVRACDGRPGSAVRVALGTAYLRCCPIRRGKGRVRNGLVRTHLTHAAREFDLPGGGRIAIQMDSELGSALLVEGGYEVAESRSICRALPPGGLAVDVGANVGLHAIQLGLKAGAAGGVWAVEPYAPTVDLLRQNLALNELSNVEVVAAAAGADDGYVTLHLADDSAYVSASTVLKPDHDVRKSLTVRQVALDSLWVIHRRPAVSVLKVDAEGGHLEVLRGAQAMIAACRPVVLMECSRDQLDEAAKLLQGYRPSQPRGFMHWNWLFMP